MASAVRSTEVRVPAVKKFDIVRRRAFWIEFSLVVRILVVNAIWKGYGTQDQPATDCAN